MQTIININQENGKPQALSTWHPINGTWVHIFQMFNQDGSIDYFVNGVEQNKLDTLPDAIDKNNISPRILNLEGTLQEIESVEVEE